jgi:hypothetical protein
VAHGQRAMAQVDNLHHVRMTALPAESVIMVAPVRRLGSARRYLGPPALDLVPDPRSTALLIRSPWVWTPWPAQTTDAATCWPCRFVKMKPPSMHRGHPLPKPLALLCPADLGRGSDQTDLTGASTFTSCRV